MGLSVISEKVHHKYIHHKFQKVNHFLVNIYLFKVNKRNARKKELNMFKVNNKRHLSGFIGVVLLPSLFSLNIFTTFSIVFLLFTLKIVEK